MTETFLDRHQDGGVVIHTTHYDDQTDEFVSHVWTAVRGPDRKVYYADPQLGIVSPEWLFGAGGHSGVVAADLYGLVRDDTAPTGARPVSFADLAGATPGGMTRVDIARDRPAAAGTPGQSGRTEESVVVRALRASGPPPDPAGPGTPATQSGLADPTAIADYVATMRALESDWASLPLADRVQRVQDALNAQLARNGVPPVRLLPTQKLPRKVDGRFNSATWTVNLDESIVLANDPMSFATLVQCTYHEGRHAEQAMLIARRMAGRGAGVGEILHTLAITNTEVLATAVTDPLVAGTAEHEAAESWLISVVGEGLQSTNRLVGTELPAARTKYAQAKETYLGTATSVDYGERLRLHQAVLDAKQEFENAYRRYLRLPEEADAWALGVAVSLAFGRPVPPPKVDVPPPPIP